MQVGKKQELNQIYFGFLKYSNLLSGDVDSLYILKVLSKVFSLMGRDRDQFMNRTLLDMTRMFALNYRYCERCSPDELRVVCSDKFVVTS